MPSYAQLQREPAWNAEQVPPNLRVLADQLREHYGLPADAIGIKGNNLHLRGAHRSRRWIRTSIWCTNRTYTVSRTPGDRSGGDDDWLAGLDIKLPPAELIAVCKRLDEAVRAGRLEKVTEWYGNTDGDNRVDGYDNIANQVATSDDSHLWHLHLTFDRGHVNDDHTDLFEILTGEDMPTVRDIWLSRESDVVPRFAPPDDPNPNMTPAYALGWTAMKVNQTYQRLGELEATQRAILEKVAGADTAAIVAAIEAQGEQTRARLEQLVSELGPAIAAAVVERVDRELDEAAVGAAVAEVLAARLAS